MVTQTVTLKTGLKYFSFWVFRDDINIDTIMSSYGEWNFARLTRITRGESTSVSTENGVWPRLPTLHEKTNVYILDIEMPGGVTEHQITYEGFVIGTLDIRLQTGKQFIPVFQDGWIKTALLIVQECPQDSTTLCTVLHYTHNDTFTLNKLDHTFPRVVKMVADDLWDRSEDMKRGQAILLALVHAGRISGTVAFVSAQYDNANENARAASYATGAVSHRRSVAAHAHRTLSSSTGNRARAGRTARAAVLPH